MLVTGEKVKEFKENISWLIYVVEGNKGNSDGGLLSFVLSGSEIWSEGRGRLPGWIGHNIHLVILLIITLEFVTTLGFSAEPNK